MCSRIYPGGWTGVGIIVNLLKIPILVPVPLHKKRLKKRGFNQSTWIARCTSERDGRKSGVSEALTGFEILLRRQNLTGARDKRM